jgi:hypothetical protein
MQKDRRPCALLTQRLQEKHRQRRWAPDASLFTLKRAIDSTARKGHLASGYSGSIPEQLSYPFIPTICAQGILNSTWIIENPPGLDLFVFVGVQSKGGHGFILPSWSHGSLPAIKNSFRSSLDGKIRDDAMTPKIPKSVFAFVCRIRQADSVFLDTGVQLIKGMMDFTRKVAGLLAFLE